MKIEIHSSIKEQNTAVAKQIADFVNENPGCLICPAGGDTPIGVYRELVNLQNQGYVDLNSAYYVGLDEWVGLGADVVGSCREMMENNLYKPAGIREDHYSIWDGLCENPMAECKRMEAFITAHNGIDLTLLGIGMNGHIGFNEPGTGMKSGCILVDLSETTKEVSVKYFGEFLPVKKGFGVGAKELNQARKIILMANGVHKKDIIRRVVKEPMNENLPASLLTDHADIILSLDTAAASEIN